MEVYKPNLQIRKVEIGNLKAGGDTSFSFMSENENVSRPLVAIEIPFIADETYPDFLKQDEEKYDFYTQFKTVSGTEADLISIKFNVKEINFDLVKVAINFAEAETSKPLILRGANNNQIDIELLPFLAKCATKRSVIAFAEENTYEKIVPAVKKGEHILALRSPIDINIAKELNILTTEMGLSADSILIDPDMGGLGYGIEYGYSIMERIKQAAFDGDNMLNMPLIAFIGEETYRAKEAKSNTFSPEWGDFEKRAQFWETTAAAAVISAGANIVVLWNPKNISTIKELSK